MDNNVNLLFDLYRKEITEHIGETKYYHASEQLKQIASLFSPGLFYYFIINFANMRMEYVSEGSKEVVGISPEDFTAEAFVGLIPPDELAAVVKKEAVVVDFLF